MIEVKILGCRFAQRYAVGQRVVAVKRDPLEERPELKIAISELKGWEDIERYTQILVAPSPAVNDQLVCEGRLPTIHEVLDWLSRALEQ
jgi:hypothetical protein